MNSLRMTQPDPKQIQSQRHPSVPEIAVRAYQVWESAGRPEGRAVEHWLTAETQLRDAAEPRPAASPLPANRYGLVFQARAPASVP